MLSWSEIIQLVILFGLIILLVITIDSWYALLRQRLMDAIPIKQKDLQRVEIHDLGPEMIELMKRKKLTTLIFDHQGVYTLKKGDHHD